MNWIVIVFTKKYFFGWSNIKDVIRQLYATLSNEKTYLSSKRLERVALFWLAAGMTACYVWHRRNAITTGELVLITTTLFGYAGFNTVQSRRDKREEKALCNPPDQADNQQQANVNTSTTTITNETKTQ